MKTAKLRFILLFVLVTHFTFGQDEIQDKAFSQAQEMIDFYNKREIPKYVDYLLPAYYGNDNKYKEKFSELWEKVLEQDSDNLELVKLLKIVKLESRYQALFQIDFRNDKSYIIGVVDNERQNWKFTQPISGNVKFDQLLEIIPNLDYSFANVIDPKFGKRIDYKIGEVIPPFAYTDIDDNQISSKTVKGQIIVLNFWGTWCAPCVKEIPDLNKLVEKYSKENVRFIAPAIYSNKETLQNDFLPKNPFLYEIILIDQNDYVISLFPTHVITNEKHEVVAIIRGYSEENIQELDNLIMETL